MAQSLVHTGKFSVNILGFYSNTHSSFRDIKFHHLNRLNSRSLARLLSNSSVFLRLLKIKPTIIIVCTPEVAPACLLYKLLFPVVKLVYDIQENYSRNIVHHHPSKKIVGKALAVIVDFIEKKLAYHANLLLIAERGYFLEKPWLNKHPHLLLENKVLPQARTEKPKISDTITIVYTGTISTMYGIWDALRFTDQLRSALKGKLQFLLLGHVTQNNTYQQLQTALVNRPWIIANISLNPVPHQLLLKAIQTANFGIVSHQILPSIENCFPTRIWEYMHYQLPFFIQNHPPWVDYCRPWKCSVPVNFASNDWPMDEFIQQMENTKFYTQGFPSSIYWEEKAFVESINRVLKKN